MSELLSLDWNNVTAEELRNDVLIRPNLDSGARVVGLVRSIGVDTPPLLFGVAGFGGSFVQYLGLDTETDRVVTGWAVEAEVSAGVGLGDFSGGSFQFFGPPEGMSGWSAYVSGSSPVGFGGSGSVTLNSEAFKMKIFGANSKIEVSGGLSWTYNLSIDNEEIYSFGLPFLDTTPIAPDPEFVADYVKAAGEVVKLISFGQTEAESAQDIVQAIAGYLNDQGIAENQLLFDPNGEDFAAAITTLTAFLARSDSDLDAATVLRGGLLDQALESLATDFALNELPRVLIDSGLGAFIPEAYRCFPAGTLITLWDGTQKPIEEITTTDVVLSRNQNGAPVVGRVDKLLRNTTTEFIRLTFDDREDLVATPGHRFLTETGDYMEIGHMLRLGGGLVRLVDSTGAIVEAQGEVIAYSAETAHLFPESASKSIAFEGNAVVVS